jgi:hypothetical protein
VAGALLDVRHHGAQAPVHVAPGGGGGVRLNPAR